jgi:hypothetical protein
LSVPIKIFKSGFSGITYTRVLPPVAPASWFIISARKIEFGDNPDLTTVLVPREKRPGEDEECHGANTHAKNIATSNIKNIGIDAIEYTIPNSILTTLAD